MDYNLVAVNGGVRRSYKDVTWVETKNENIVRLSDSENHVIAVMHLAPGERIERIP